MMRGVINPRDSIPAGFSNIGQRFEKMWWFSRLHCRHFSISKLIQLIFLQLARRLHCQKLFSTVRGIFTMRVPWLLACLFSAQAFAYPITYTVDGTGSTPPGGQSPNYSFTTTFVVDNEQIGRQYVDGVEQEIPGSWFASILSFQDSAGNSFTFAPGGDTENGSYYAMQNVNSSGTEAYTYLRFAEDDLFKINMVSSEFYSDWHLGTLFEINISSDILPSPGNFGRIVAISSSVPEPGSLALILSGFCGLVMTRRIRR